MKKIIISLMCLIFACFGLACGDTPPPKEGKLIESYVGSYNKEVGAMGGMLSGAHLINFYDNGTVKIYNAATNPQGTVADVYSGTYSVDNGRCTIDYKYKVADDTKIKEGTATFNKSGDVFRAQIFLAAAFPDDGDDTANQGLNYYKVEPREFMSNAANYAGAVKTDDGGVRAYYLSIDKDGKFTASVHIDGVIGIIEGTAVEIYGELSDSLELTYDIKSIDGKTLGGTAEADYTATIQNYNDSAFGLSLKIGSSESEDVFARVVNLK